MPKIKINDTTIAYETWGEGPPIVLTPHGWFMRPQHIYIMAGRLSKEYQVILWDRPNCGASDINIADVPTEHHLWTDVMHEFLAVLNLGPAHFAGASNGCAFSLQMALRYPKDVKRLILIEPGSSDAEVLLPIINPRYLEFAAIAAEQGMQAVIDHSVAAYHRVISTVENRPWDVIRNWIAETIVANPENAQRLLAMDADYFSGVMQRWGDWYLSGELSTARLSVDELQQLVMPALVLPGIDPLHPQAAAETLAAQLPNAKLVDYLEHYSAAKIREVQESDAVYTLKAFFMLPFIEEFLQGHQ